MKAIQVLCCTFLFMLSFVLLSQEVHLLNTENRISFNNIRVDNNGDFISILMEDSANYHYTGGLIKFNSDFDYELYIHDIDTAHVVFNDFVITAENNYLITGTIGKDNGIGYSNHIIYFLLLDENFNFITENLYSLPTQYTNPFIKMLKNSDGRIYVTIDRGGPPNILKGIIELSSSSQILKEEIYFDMGGSIMNPFPFDDNGFYLLRGSEVPWAVGQITKVDTNLNFTSTVLPYYINGQYYEMGSRGSCKWLNDTTYILISEGHYETYGHDLYMYKMNNNHEFLTEPFIIGRDNINDQSLYYRGIDWSTPEVIYVAGWEWASMYSQTNYYVAVTNENFEVLGAKSYGGDNNTAVTSMLATEDGGCVMVGGQRDYLAGDEFDWDGYVAFFQPDDIITSAAETPNPNDSDYILFPNPGNDYFLVQTARKEVQLRVFDESGRLIIKHSLDNNFRNHINTQEFNPSIYFCLFIDKYGNTECKKWIKQ
ncbi:MAG: T9SS type A sorting domain-containing protein [Bacteroidales bacterium]|nr:T9SS type A sorting domain-containing protein [Bacteroidales bacterium]